MLIKFLQGFQHIIAWSQDGESVELKIWAPRQSIRYVVWFAQAVVDGKVKGGQIFFPSCLPGGESLLAVEELKGSMIGDQSSMPPVQVHTPGLHSMDNGQKLFLMETVLALCRAEFA